MAKENPDFDENSLFDDDVEQNNSSETAAAMIARFQAAADERRGGQGMADASRVLRTLILNDELSVEWLQRLFARVRPENPAGATPALAVRTIEIACQTGKMSGYILGVIEKAIMSDINPYLTGPQNQRIENERCWGAIMTDTRLFNLYRPFMSGFENIDGLEKDAEIEDDDIDPEDDEPTGAMQLMSALGNNANAARELVTDDRITTENISALLKTAQASAPFGGVERVISNIISEGCKTGKMNIEMLIALREAIHQYRDPLFSVLLNQHNSVVRRLMELVLDDETLVSYAEKNVDIQAFLESELDVGFDDGFDDDQTTPDLELDSDLFLGASTLAMLRAQREKDDFESFEPDDSETDDLG